MKIQLDTKSILEQHSHNLAKKFEVVTYNVANSDNESFERSDYYTHFNSNGLNKSKILLSSDFLLLKELINSESELKYFSKKLEIYNTISNIMGQPENGKYSLADYPVNLSAAVNKVFEAAQILHVDPANIANQTLFREKCSELTTFFHDSTEKLYTLYNDITAELNKSFDSINSTLTEVVEINKKINKQGFKDINLQEAFNQQKLLMQKISNELKIEQQITSNQNLNLNTENNKYQLVNGTVLSEFHYYNDYNIYSDKAEETFSVTLTTGESTKEKILYEKDLGRCKILAMIEMKKEIQDTIEHMNELSIKLSEEINSIQNQGVKIEGYNHISSNTQYTKSQKVIHNSDLEIVLMDKLTGQSLQYDKTNDIYIKPYKVSMHEKTVGELMNDINQYFTTPSHILDEEIKSIRLVNKGLSNKHFNFNLEIDNQSEKDIEVTLKNMCIKYYDEINNKYTDITDSALDFEKYLTTVSNQFVNLALDKNINVNLQSVPTAQDNIFIEMDIDYDLKRIPVSFKINLNNMSIDKNIDLRVNLDDHSPTIGHKIYQEKNGLLSANLVDDKGNLIVQNNKEGHIKIKTNNIESAVYIKELQNDRYSDKSFLEESEFFNLFNKSNIAKHAANTLNYTDLDFHNTLLEDKENMCYEVAVSDNKNISKLLELQNKELLFKNGAFSLNKFSVDIIDTVSVKTVKQNNIYEIYNRYNASVADNYQNMTGVSLPDEKTKAIDIKQKMAVVNELIKKYFEIQETLIRLLN